MSNPYGIPLKVRHLDEVATLINRYSALEDEIQKKEQEIHELENPEWGSADHSFELVQRQRKAADLKEETYKLEQQKEELVSEIEEAFSAGSKKIAREIVPKMVADAKRMIWLLDKVCDISERLVEASETVRKQNMELANTYPAAADGSTAMIQLPEDAQELHKNALLQKANPAFIRGGSTVGRNVRGAIPTLKNFVRAAESWLNKRGMDVPELGDILPEPDIADPEAKSTGLFDSLTL